MLPSSCFPSFGLPCSGLRAAIATLVSGIALGQSYNNHTVAGGGLPVNFPATSAYLDFVQEVAVDSSENLFLAVPAYSAVLRRDAATGVLTLVVANGPSFSGDNRPASSAELNAPRGVALDTAGNLYIADAGNDLIREVSNGLITTVARNGTPGYSGDNGPASSAELAYPSGGAVDSAGDLYIRDQDNNRIRKVYTGLITTVAGKRHACSVLQACARIGGGYTR